MGRIVVDLGNSRLKWGRVTPDGRLEKTGALPLGGSSRSSSGKLGLDPAYGDAWAELVGWVETQLPFDDWSIASVNPPVAERLAALFEARGIVGTRWYRSAADAPVRHDLEHPETAGADRALAVLGVLANRPGPGLVVSCGTAITVERISPQGVWQGGAIGPGLGPMAKALNLMTAQLPEVDPGDTPEPLGRSTVPAIEAGVFWGVVGLIRELLTRQADGVTPLPWVTWTGGDAERFARWVEWPGSVVSPNLVLEGLIRAGS